MIAVTGASGYLGRATFQFLLQKVAASNTIAIVRNPETVNDLKNRGVLIRLADYNDYDALNQAFKGVEKLLQVSTIGVDLATAKIQGRNVVKAMVANNIND